MKDKRTILAFLLMTASLSACLAGCGATTGASNTPHYSGQNRIIFQGYRDVLDADWRKYGELYSVKSDGSDLRRITNNLWLEDQPDVSPDRSKIVFAIHFAITETTESVDPGWEIAVSNIDGSGITNITSNEWLDSAAHWNHDGSRIVFLSDSAHRSQADIDAGVPIRMDIYAMDPDGGNMTKLTDAASDEVFADPSFSFNTPSRVVYVHSASSPHDDYDLWVMDADGSNKQMLLAHTATLEAINDPMFNPDASRIIFEADMGNDTFGNPIYRMFTVDPSGGDLTAVGSADGISRGLAQYSTDGAEIAYMAVQFYATSAGSTEIRTSGYDGGVEKIITSSPGDGAPSWY